MVGGVLFGRFFCFEQSKCYVQKFESLLSTYAKENFPDSPGHDILAIFSGLVQGWFAVIKTELDI